MKLRVGDELRVRWWNPLAGLFATNHGIVSAVYPDGSFSIGKQAYLANETWLFYKVKR